MSSVTGKTNIALVVITAAVTASVIFIGYRAERYASSTGFCLKCHSMSYPYEGLKKSVHYGRVGMDPQCRDCHFPPGFAGKVKTHIFEGLKDTVSSFRLDLSTPDAFARHKDEFAEKARGAIRATRSASCRACHKNPRPASVYGQESHKKLATGEATCVDCHQGIFHD